MTKDILSLLHQQLNVFPEWQKTVLLNLSFLSLFLLLLTSIAARFDKLSKSKSAQLATSFLVELDKDPIEYPWISRLAGYGMAITYYMFALLGFYVFISISFWWLDSYEQLTLLQNWVVFVSIGLIAQAIRIFKASGGKVLVALRTKGKAQS